MLSPTHSDVFYLCIYFDKHISNVFYWLNLNFNICTGNVIYWQRIYFNTSISFLPSPASWWRSPPTTVRRWARPCRCSSTSATASGKGANHSDSPTCQVGGRFLLNTNRRVSFTPIFPNLFSRDPHFQKKLWKHYIRYTVHLYT